MPKEVLYATGVFEIGDTFTDETGAGHIVTDVLVCHYIKEGAFKVLYELDGSGNFVQLKLQEGRAPKSKILQMPKYIASITEDNET